MYRLDELHFVYCTTLLFVYMYILLHDLTYICISVYLYISILVYGNFFRGILSGNYGVQFLLKNKRRRVIK